MPFFVGLRRQVVHQQAKLRHEIEHERARGRIDVEHVLEAGGMGPATGAVVEQDGNHHRKPGDPRSLSGARDGCPVVLEPGAQKPDRILELAEHEQRLR
jgi:hypothetical protein